MKDETASPLDAHAAPTPELIEALKSYLDKGGKESEHECLLCRLEQWLEQGRRELNEMLSHKV